MRRSWTLVCVTGLPLAACGSEASDGAPVPTTATPAAMEIADEWPAVTAPIVAEVRTAAEGGG